MRGVPTMKMDDHNGRAAVGDALSATIKSSRAVAEIEFGRRYRGVETGIEGVPLTVSIDLSTYARVLPTPGGAAEPQWVDAENLELVTG